MSGEDRQLVEAHVAAGRFFREQLLQPGGDGRLRTRFSVGWGMLRASSPWKVGYAPEGWARLVDHLRSQGFAGATLLTAGLASATRKRYLVDRFRDRIMFPAWDAGQELVWFCGALARWTDQVLNSPSTPIYQKSQTLVGLAEQRDLLDSGATPSVR